VLDQDTRRTERVLLEIRLSDGLPLDVLADRASAEVALAELVGDGLVTVDRGRLVLTLRGRLLADAVVRALVA
jgi:oxygen-independent coproporphyrinogen-3 oxidase